MRMIGLAKKAGAMVANTEGVRALLRAKRACLVLMANDCSQNTVKRIVNSCSFYSVQLIRTDISMEELGNTVGTFKCSAVAISDKGFANAIKEKGANIWQ